MRVLVFGDSIAQGFWDAEGGWVSRLRKFYDTQSITENKKDYPTIFNLGISGDSSADLLARFTHETTARLMDNLVFVFAIGINDARIAAGINFSSPTYYRQNLQKLFNEAKIYSSKILFVGLTPCIETRTNPVSWGDISYTNTRIKAFDDTQREFCQENLIEFVEVFEPLRMAQQQAELLPDGVHPNGKGHQLIADLVRPKLEIFS